MADSQVEAIESDLKVAYEIDRPESVSDKQGDVSSEHTAEAGSDAEKPQPQKVTLPDGTQVTYEEIQEWRKGYLRESDYTQKTQKLAEERRSLEQLRRRLEPLLQIEQYLQANPQLFQEIQASLKAKGYVPSQQAGASYDPRIVRIEEQLAEMQLERELQTVRSQANADRAKLGLPPLSDEQWSQLSVDLLRHALDNGVSVRLAYRNLPHFDAWIEEAVKSASQKAIDQYKQKQSTLAGSVIQGTPKKPPMQGVIPAKNLGEEAVRAAYADLKASGISLFTNEEE